MLGMWTILEGEIRLEVYRAAPCERTNVMTRTRGSVGGELRGGKREACGCGVHRFLGMVVSVKERFTDAPLPDFSQRRDERKQEQHIYRHRGTSGSSFHNLFARA